MSPVSALLNDILQGVWVEKGLLVWVFGWKEVLDVFGKFLGGKCVDNGLFRISNDVT